MRFLTIELRLRIGSPHVIREVYTYPRVQVRLNIISLLLLVIRGVKKWARS